MKKLECAQPNGLRHEPRTNLSTQEEYGHTIRPITWFTALQFLCQIWQRRHIGYRDRVQSWRIRAERSIPQYKQPLSWYSPDLNTCISAQRGRGTGFRTSGTSRCCVDTFVVLNCVGEWVRLPTDGAVELSGGVCC